MKKLVAFILAMAMMTGLTACGGTDGTNTAENTGSTSTTDTASGDAPTLAFICKDLSQEWFVDTSTAMKETALSMGAKDVIMYDCAMSPDKYMTALDNAISQDVDVLIVCPPDQNLSQVTVQRCEEAGIRVMADDDALIDEAGNRIAPVLELDAYKVGQSTGEYLANYVNENNLSGSNVGYLVMTMSEVSSCVPRSEGARDKFVEMCPDFPSAQIIEADYDGTTDKGFNVAAATITAHPEIDTWLVSAPNDEGAQGAARALEQAGLDKNATVVGVGGYLAKDEFKKDYSCFKATAYIDPVEDGRTAATAAMEWYLNDTVPYSEYIKDGEQFGVYPLGAVMIDANNYEEVMGESAN